MKNKMIFKILMLCLCNPIYASTSARRQVIKKQLDPFLAQDSNTWTDADIARMKSLVQELQRGKDSSAQLYDVKITAGEEKRGMVKGIGGTGTGTGLGTGTGTVQPSAPNAPQAPTTQPLAPQAPGTTATTTPSITTRPTTDTTSTPASSTSSTTSSVLKPATETITVPLAPEAPEAPSGPKRKQEQEKLKPTPKPTGLLPLTPQQLAALSGEEKRASDRVFAEVIVALAKQYDSFEKYKAAIKNAFSELLKKDAFKKREELSAVISTLDAFIKNNVTYSADFASKAQAATDDLGKLVIPCVFDAKAFQENVALYLSLLAVSIAASQRTVIEPGHPQKVISDSTALDAIRTIVEAVQQDSGYKAYEQRKKVEATSELESKIKQEVTTSATLIHDYLMLLHSHINTLRVQKEFLQFVPPIKRLKEARGPIDELITRPLLFLLLSSNSAELNARIIHGALSTQLLFSPDELDTVLQKDSLVLKAMIEDHTQRLKTFKKAPLAEFLNDRLVFAKNIKDILAALEEARSNAELQGTQTKDIHDVISTFRTYNPDQKLISEKLSSFGVKTETITKLMDFVSKYSKDKEKAGKAVEILKLAKQRYDKKTKTPIGDFIVSEIEKQKLLGAARLEKLKGLYRTPEGVQQAFVNIIGSPDEVNKLAKKDDFYQWIESYGVLFEVLNSALARFKDLANAQEKWDMLLATLAAMNENKILPNKPYAPAVSINKGFIETGVFKGKLEKLIKELQAYNIRQANTELTTLAEKAAAYPEFAEFSADFNTALVAIILGLLKNELEALNAGKNRAILEVPGIELKGSVAKRNAQIYLQWYGIFKDLIAYLGKDISQFNDTIFNVEKDKIMKAAQDKLNSPNITYLTTSAAPAIKEQKDEVLRALSTYLDGMQQKLANLHAVSTTAKHAEVKHEQEKIESDGGVPVAPPPPGDAGDGIPEAPPL